MMAARAEVGSGKPVITESAHHIRQTEEGRKLYDQRAGVEVTIPQSAIGAGLRRIRYLGVQRRN